MHRRARGHGGTRKQELKREKPERSTAGEEPPLTRSEARRVDSWPHGGSLRNSLEGGVALRPCSPEDSRPPRLCPQPSRRGSALSPCQALPGQGTLPRGHSSAPATARALRSHTAPRGAGPMESGAAAARTRTTAPPKVTNKISGGPASPGCVRTDTIQRALGRHVLSTLAAGSSPAEETRLAANDQ